MPDKKPYSTPQLVQVALNHEQAILTVCETGTSAVQHTASPGFCKSAVPNACKRKSNNPGTNNAGRPS